MEDNLLSETSSLNTPIDDILPGCSKNIEIEDTSEPEDEDEITSLPTNLPESRQQRRTKRTEATGKEKQKQKTSTH